ncbi:MAG: MgtC/SapB family protein [Bacteroidales bacterium]|nr:MgtC/SapB family protein [Bacteroidales bacterium]
MTIQVYLFRITCAVVLGILIGLERQIRQRNAGLVTNTLVAIGACTFILTSETLIANAVASGGQVNNDNLRVLSQIVTGIGFLGAGVILKNGFSIHGLNSAATLWCSAAVGSLCGYGLWREALISVVAILFVNWILKYVEQRIEARFAHTSPHSKDDKPAPSNTAEQ